MMTEDEPARCDKGISYLAEEAGEELTEQIDRIATHAAQRALTAQKYREAGIFLDAVRSQIRFHDSLDEGWSKVMGASRVQGREYPAGDSELVAKQDGQASFNRWLMIENSLAAAIPALLVPDREAGPFLNIISARLWSMSLLFRLWAIIENQFLRVRA